VLAIETATDMCGLALLEDERLVSEMSFRHRMSLSQRLAPNLGHLLHDACQTLQEVDLIAVSTGPGSFTGLRVGVVMAKTLAWILSKPVVGVSTLEALAANASLWEAHNMLLCPIIHARRGEVYAAIYRQLPADATATEGILRLTPLYPPEALEDSLLLERLSAIEEPFVCMGDGAVRLKEAIREATHRRAQFLSGTLLFPHAQQVGLLGFHKMQAGQSDDPLALTPAYLKKSVAEIRRETTGMREVDHQAAHGH